MKHEMTEAGVGTVMKVAPPIAVVGASLAGLTIQDWAYALTALYSFLMIVSHIWKEWVKPWFKRGRSK